MPQVLLVVLGGDTFVVAYSKRVLLNVVSGPQADVGWQPYDGLRLQGAGTAGVYQRRQSPRSKPHGPFQPVIRRVPGFGGHYGTRSEVAIFTLIGPSDVADTVIRPASTRFYGQLFAAAPRDFCSPQFR